MTTAEVAFPIERRAFGPGEEYPLDQFGKWNVVCERDEDGEDFCYPKTVVADYEVGLELVVAVYPFGPADTIYEVDVDVAPRADIGVFPNSDADHYSRYSAAILSVDQLSFDGYWCELGDVEDCFRGPIIGALELNTLLEGRNAVITILRPSDTDVKFREVTKINLDLSDLGQAYNRAVEFNAAIYGVSREDLIWTEMCTYREDGREKRIRFTFDDDFDSSEQSFRESTWGPKLGGTCPSYVTRAYLVQDATYAQRQLFCLVADEDGELVGFQQGERDAYGLCAAPSRSFCEVVNDSKDAATIITKSASAAITTVAGATKLAGVSVVAHSSGASILTGSSGYVAGTLGTMGAGALSVLTAPATAAAATVSVIAVSGAVYACSE